MNAKKKRKFSRRKFLIRSSIGVAVIVGGGLFAVAPGRRQLAKMLDEIDQEYENGDAPQVWFEVRADNTLILHSPKVEMGQGIFTGLAQIVADEMEVDFNKIQVVNATTNGGPIDSFATGGSTSVSGLWNPLRELAAQMREMLRNSAASILQLPATDLSIKNGVITGKGKQMTYGEVVQKTKEWKISGEVALKDSKDYKYIGKPLARVDLKAKVVGESMFGIDVSMPGMLYGAVVRPDKLDVTFEGADVSKAEKMPGVVKVALEKDFVGVVAKSYIEAHNAKKAIKAKWKVNKVWQQKDIEDMIQVGKGKPILIQKSGSAIDDDEPGVITATFKSPIGAHAQIEPNGCVAFVEKDKATIKLSTQVVQMTREMVAKRLGLDEDKVEVQAAYLGGGFGRRLFSPHAIFAAVLSKAVGKPVHMTYDRKEEFQNDTFRPPTEHLLKGKLNKQGQIEAIEHNVSSGDVAFGSPLIEGYIKVLAGADFGAWRGGLIQYKKIPNIRTTSWRVKLPFATSWWRSLGLLANTFAIESFIDELAIKAGKDPVQFRLAMTANDERGKKLKGVIEAAAKKAGWDTRLPPNGRALGFAASTDANTPVAQVAEVSIVDNKIKIHKVTCAIDPGIAVNPDSIRAQCEGAIIMGISASMFEKMEQ